MDNIISFPVDKRKNAILHEKLEKAYLEDDENYSLTLENTDEILSMIIAEMIEMGYPLHEEKYISEVSFLWECIKACLMSVNGEDHPLLEVAERLYSQYIREEDDPIQLEFDF